MTSPLVSAFDMRNGKATEERMYSDNARSWSNWGWTPLAALDAPPTAVAEGVLVPGPKPSSHARYRH